MDSHVGSAIQIIIGVVIGVLVLGVLYLLFKNTVLPSISNSVSSMVTYTG